jgi:hypothetical protein
MFTRVGNFLLSQSYQHHHKKQRLLEVLGISVGFGRGVVTGERSSFLGSSTFLRVVNDLEVDSVMVL